MHKLRALLLPLVACHFLTANAQSPNTLQLGTPIERTLAPGSAHEFTITLEANNFIQLVVEQRGIDVIVKVFSPAGKSLGEYDSPNGPDGPEHVSFVGIAAGGYRITVSPLDPHDAVTGRYQIKLLEQRQANEQEIKAGKNQEVVVAKALALVSEIEGIIPQIKSPFTRIRAQLHTAQFLWDSDDKRAARYIADAATGVKEFIASVDGSTPEYSQQFQAISQLRFEILNVLSERDPDAALNFLYSTVPPPNPYGDRREQGVQESMLELSVANRIARNDAHRAFQIAKQVLKKRATSSLMTVVTQLRRQNPELAAELTTEIASKLLNEKLLSNHDAASLAMGLLRFGRAPLKWQPSEENIKLTRLTLLSESQFRELLQKAYNDAMSYSNSTSHNPERDAAWNLLNGLQQIGPDLDQFVSGGATAVQKRLAEISNQQVPGNYELQNALANTSTDEALERIGKAPLEQREQLYVQLAGREANNGNIARARQIVNERVSTPYQRQQALSNLDQQEIHNASGKGKVEEALRIIGGFRTPRERATLVAQIAMQIGPGQKRANAINLLEQAKSLLSSSPQAQDQDQMIALIEIARAFGKYDAKRSFEILDPLIEQVNDLCVAARTLEGFGSDFYEDEELDLQNGNSVAQAAMRVTNTLGTLALVNFDRARAASDRLRLPEVRLRAYLDIAQQAIRGNLESRR